MVYVAGPISGDPFGCVRQAVDAWERLRAVGLVPFLPQLSVLHEMVRPVGYEAWLAYDFDVIRNSEAVVRLPGHSPGADGEVAFAAELALPVFELPEDWELLERWAASLHARRCDDPHCDRVGVYEQLRRGIPLADRITLDDMGIGRDA